MRSKTATALLILTTLLLLFDSPASAAPAPDAERFTIRLGAAETTPEAGSRTTPNDADAPFLVQLRELPDQVLD